MSVLDTVALALSALTGGLVGAASAAYLASLKVAGNLDGFRTTFMEYMNGRTDEASQMLAMSFDELDRSWKSFGVALDRLAKAARVRR